MTARNGLRVGTRSDGKVIVTTPPDGSLIAFEDLFRIERAIVLYEIRKYGGPNADPGHRDTWERWAQKPLGFLIESLKHDADLERLLRKYEVPDRTTVVPARPVTQAADDFGTPEFLAAWEAAERKSA